jgi:hypothetical protein
MPTPNNEKEEYAEKICRGMCCGSQHELLQVVVISTPLSKTFWKLRSQILHSEVFKFEFKKSFLIAFVCYVYFM